MSIRWSIRWMAAAGFIAGSLLMATLPTSAAQAEPGRCPNGKSMSSATWLSVAHPGLGEWYLNDWGSFNENCPRKKFWLGFIPFYGWPGYLQILSATDANNCRTVDRLS